MVQHLVDRAIIERRAQGNCRSDWVCALAAWHWFSAMSYVFLLALFFDLRTKRTAMSSLCLTAFLCVVARTCKAIRTRFHGIVLFVASCYFLSSSAAFANLESNRHTQIALVFCIFPLFLPPPSSSFLLDTELQCKRAHSQRPRQRTPP